MQATLSSLTIYPVKSCRGIDLERANLDRFGLTGDRRWMLVDEAGRFITQREHAQIALLETGWQDELLTLRWETDTLDVVVPSANAPMREVKIWMDSVAVHDAGSEVAEWLKQRLKLTCRLVYMPRCCQRTVDPDYTNRVHNVSFADGFPLLLISQASLDDLNQRLPTPVPMDRFRPNLVVSGCGPFAEDEWQRIRIRNIEFDVAKPCSRCVIPSIDQQTAQRDRTINRTLASFRRRDGTIYFGQNVLHHAHGALKVGDEVQVLA